MNKKDIQHIRREYQMSGLTKSDVSDNPFKQFEKWFNEAINSEMKDPTAMFLATSSNEKPNVRTVLLKGFDDFGFVFYTNYISKKAQEIEENPNASILFYWQELERQVRIEGVLEKVSTQESDEYFASRPKGSKIGALASTQSSILESREVLEQKISDLEEQYKDTDDIPRPDSWGGYRLTPYYIEFWQGRASRLHDRIIYKIIDGNWKIFRLAP